MSSSRLHHRRTPLVAGGVLAASAAVGGRVLFERRIRHEIDAFLSEAADGVPGDVTEADLVGLPEPMQRWLRHSNMVGKPRPRTARLRQDGQFRLGPRWTRLQAEQYFTIDPPGFLWWARMRMAPLVSVAGRDRYADGIGDMDMRMLGLVPVVRKSGGGLNQGDLQRFLTETIWFPAGILSPYISWEQVEANSARATMTYAGETGSAVFTVDEQGRLLTMTALRYNDARRRLENWAISVSGYRGFDGVRIAAEGDGTWNYESGDYTYIRWRITDLDWNQPTRY